MTRVMEGISYRILTTPDDLTDAFEVRRKVFQQEQGIDAKLDFDGKDDESIHIVIYSNNVPVGTGRIRTLEKGQAKIERVAVVSKKRGHGIGKLIINTMHEYLETHDVESVCLDSQLHAKGFYEGLGYEQKGDIFEEVGIPHVIMEKRFK